ncbi:MAG: 4Fe-4S dicluster domain-containing protein [Candidatus Hodarchaeota archaeon]
MTIQSRSEEITAAVKDAVKKLFAKGKVDLVIGYTDGTLPLRAQPLFMKSADDVDDFKWNNLGYINIAKYALEKRTKKVDDKDVDLKIGIVAKGCVGRAINHLIVENQIKRENVVIIGFPCNGIADVNKIEKDLGEKEALEVNLDGDNLVVKGNGFEKSYPIAENVNTVCKVCKIKTPTVADVMVLEGKNLPLDDDFADIAEHNKKATAEKWDETISTLHDCIRCYSCRQACPMCYCSLCFVDQNKPMWFDKTSSMQDIFTFHLVRSLHMAGRCVSCGACTAACPMHIDLNFITRKLQELAKRRFDFVSGLDQDTLPPLSAFKMNDEQEFMLEEE